MGYLTGVEEGAALLTGLIVALSAILGMAIVLIKLMPLLIEIISYICEVIYEKIKPTIVLTTFLLTLIVNTVVSGVRTIGRRTRVKVKELKKALKEALRVSIATSKVIEKVKKIRDRYYKFFLISFPNDIPVLGKSLNKEKAIKAVRSGLSVITYYRSDARYVANKAGGAKAECDQKHGGVGFFNHYHIHGRPNHAHVFYIIGG